MVKVAVLGSTNGTDMQAIIDAISTGDLDAEIKLVISNKKEAYILERARKHNLKSIFIDHQDKTREEFDSIVMEELEKNDIELVLLIGYMRFLSKGFVEKYKNRIMNVHPSLLPAFAGGMDKNVHQAVLDHGAKVTGCTIHFVDEGADSGPIILQKAVDINEDDTADSLKQKVQHEEGQLFVKAIKLFQQARLKVNGNRVMII